MRLRPSGRSGQIVLRTRDLQVGHGVTPLFDGDDIYLERMERVALIGPNGSGKTTFLRTLVGDLPPLAGTVSLGASLSIGYFAQAHDALDRDNTVLEELLRHRNLPLPEARNYLAQYLFRGDDVFVKVGSLSGGERGAKSGPPPADPTRLALEKARMLVTLEEQIAQAEAALAQYGQQLEICHEGGHGVDIAKITRAYGDTQAELDRLLEEWAVVAS